MAVYTQIDNPELYFQSVLWNGNSSTQAITLGGEEDMQPDFVWIKSRNNTGTNNVGNHRNYDSVRGVEKLLYSNLTNAEADASTGLTAFGSNGFTLGNDANSNATNGTYIAWCWKESATSGFDIVSYTGNATARTISHSLSAVPHVIIVKPRESGSEGWAVYHKGIASDAETDFIRMDETNAASDHADYWNDTAPTSSVFTVGTDSAVNTNTEGVIAYLFSEKQGFSKFGSYTGNGNADGTFIYTGFRPAWVMIKKSSATGDSWQIHDNKRDTFNVAETRLLSNSSNADATNTDNLDMLSNGFKIRNSDANFGTSGATYIYMAFAEAPFVNSNGVPCNAR